MISIFLLEGKKLLSYKFQLVFSLLHPLFGFLVQYYLWGALYATQYASGMSYSDDQMFTYYAVASILFVMIKTNSGMIANEFKNGLLDNELVRPINLIKYRLWRSISERCLYTVFYLAMLFLLVAALKISAFGDISLIHLVSFVVFTILSFLISFFLDFITGLLAMAIDEVWAVQAILSFIVNFISGYYIPLLLFPGHIEAIFQFTPFYYLFYFPAQIFTLSRIDQSIMKPLLIALFWVFALVIMSNGICKRLSNGYSSYAG
ncbi:MAG: ABC-2 family transporter protein [Oscillospiraceae bacterium]|jgi:ABC-2 type transport system permease protein|nr:ABC-2 family transporter protein [Oscillospiraceae bacterium]